ncbi:flagellar assembly protein FliW [Paenibacillus sp. N3.4]|uniref:flagellar assembly protein FliW n=1 Tax=Paenibacillus sp. N3.4 TaxID=2603222 RepID=UPI0011C8F0AB|nr:flagellar assembly protein FliW [Paenibacillus sp. N3.4]TXK80949.1 flagellar assembly protein FliW [Paenibacillus sp. N3.4]
MKINTLFFGELQVEEAEIITFPNGIPGFEEFTQFTLVQSAESAPFSYMQSIQQGELSFLVTDPFLFFKDYEISLTESVQEELKIEQPTDVQLRIVVTVSDDNTKITANLLAPIVWNTIKQLAKQVILHDSDYQVKHELIISDLNKTMQEQVEG